MVIIQIGIGGALLVKRGGQSLQQIRIVVIFESLHDQLKQFWIVCHMLWTESTHQINNNV